MWKEKIKKIFGSSVNYGFKQIISLLVVFSLGLSPLLALPWRSVNSLNLMMDSSSTKTSQMNSMQSSNEVRMNQVLESEQAKKVLESVETLSANTLIEDLIEADKELENAYVSLNKVEGELEHSQNLIKILEGDNQRTNDTLVETTNEKNNLLTENLKLKEEAYGTKCITKVTGTYNRLDGFGVGGALGLRFGRGLILEVGATVPLSVVSNPPELLNYRKYDFEASLGWEW